MSIVSPGTTVFYEVESPHSLEGKPVDLEVVVQQTGESPTTWTEQVSAMRGAGTNTWLVEWTVRLAPPGTTVTCHPPVDIQLRLPAFATQLDALRVVRGIRVTDDPVLTRIMRHEFHREAPAGGWEFDPAVAEKVVLDLTPEQRSLLLNYPLRPGEKSRLVVFATLTRPEKHRVMCADRKKKPGPVLSNATWSVFRCAGPDEDVVLASHTEYLLVNDLSAATCRRFKALHAAGALDPRTTSPSMFRLATGAPDAHNSNVPWIRCFDPQGRDFMVEGTQSNAIHGVINTIACWMLFRNYNWPREHAAKFDQFYREVIRKKRWLTPAELQQQLHELAPGYDRMKMWRFDLNFAFLWFMHDVVGLKYWDSWEWVNDLGVGEEVAKDLAPGERYVPPNLLPDEAGKNAYVTPKGKTFSDDALWRPNVFGDPPWQFARKMVAKQVGGQPARVLENIDQASWADIYFYMEPGAPVLAPF